MKKLLFFVLLAQCFNGFAQNDYDDACENSFVKTRVNKKSLINDTTILKTKSFLVYSDNNTSLKMSFTRLGGKQYAQVQTNYFGMKAQYITLSEGSKIIFIYSNGDSSTIVFASAGQFIMQPYLAGYFNKTILNNSILSDLISKNIIRVDLFNPAASDPGLVNISCVLSKRDIDKLKSIAWCFKAKIDKK